MGKRFFFINEYGSDIAEAWRGPFNLTPIPRINEKIVIRCLDKKIREGIVTSITYRFDEFEIFIFLKLLP